MWFKLLCLVWMLAALTQGASAAGETLTGPELSGPYTVFTHGDGVPGGPLLTLSAPPGELRSGGFVAAEWPAPERVTIASRFTVQPGRGLHWIIPAALFAPSALEPAAQPSLQLAVALRVESSPFGAVASLHLVGAPGVFAAGTPLGNAELPVFGEREIYDAGWRALIQTGREYVAVLSVDASAGSASVRLAPWDGAGGGQSGLSARLQSGAEAGAEPLYEAHLAICPLPGPLLAGWGASAETKDPGARWSMSVDDWLVTGGFVRLGPPALLRGRTVRFSVEPAGSTQEPHAGPFAYADQPLRVIVEGAGISTGGPESDAGPLGLSGGLEAPSHEAVERPRRALPGVFRLVAAAHGGAERVLWSGTLGSRAEWVLVGHGLAPGRYTFSLRYEEPGYQVDVASQALMLLAGTVTARFQLAPPSGGEGPFAGLLHLEADREIRGLPLAVEASGSGPSEKRTLWHGQLDLVPGRPVEIRFLVEREAVVHAKSFAVAAAPDLPVRLLEEIDVYTVAILQGAAGGETSGGLDAAAVQAALEREGMIARIISAEEFLRLAQTGSPMPRALVVPPAPRLSAELSQAVSAYAKGGGDLVILGEAGIELARVDVGVGLPIFSPYEPYVLYDLAGSSAVESTGALAQAFGLKEGSRAGWESGEVVFRGAVSGHSAVGYVYPDASRYWPLLAARDGYGRIRGWGAGVLAHFGGPYRGGQWLISGVTTDEFYASPKFVEFLAAVLRLFRDETFVEMAVQENREKIAALESFEPQTPAPAGPIRLSDDGRSLVTAAGEPFFMIGANYAGPFGHGFGFGSIDVRAIEEDFRKASWAGINAFRLWSAAEASPKLKSVLSEMARKYGIYLLIVLPHPSEMATIESYLERVRRIVRIWADEPMVIGYDLANEPDIQRIGGIRYGGEPTAVIKLEPFERFRRFIDARKIENEVRSNAYPGSPPHTTFEENLHLRAARELWLGEVAGKATQRGRDYSTMSRFTGSVEVPEALKPLHEAVEATFAQWIGSLTQAIREIAPHQLVTVGYDQFYAVLDANEALDFVNHHVYQRPTAYAEVEKNLTTLDRLRLRWPGKPVSFGEFGYSSGYIMPDGKPLDPYTAAVGEIMFYLDGFAKGYSGAMIWLLNERPVANMRYNEPWMQGPDLRYEERFGVFYYDGGGTLKGKPKPVAHAMRFFARWARRHSPGEGTFTLTRSATRIGAGYVFRADDALFVGDVAYDGPGLSFRSGGAVNVMLMRTEGALELMATADVTVRLDPAYFLPGLEASVSIRGMHGGARWDGRAWEIQLLEGETVVVSLES